MSKREVGCFAVIALIAAGVLWWWFSPSAEDDANEPFASVMAEYLALRWEPGKVQEVRGAARFIKPRIIVIDADEKRLDPVHFALPETLRASGPAQVETIVFVDCTTKRVGSFGLLSNAYSRLCEISVVHKSGRRPFRMTGYRTAPPRRTYFTFWDHTAPRPNELMAEDIAKAVRR